MTSSISLRPTPSGHRAGTEGGDIPFCKTVITEDAQSAALDVLRSGWVTTGVESLAFEEEFAHWIGADDAVSVSSCTAALEISIRLLDLPPASRILTPTLTFCGAVQAIIRAGHYPVLVDLDDRTLGVSEEGVDAASSDGADAMVVQHMAGYPLDVDSLAAAAHLPANRIVEDAAHGLGASHDGVRLGSGSHAACFSFYATKNLPIGEGGALTTSDPALAERARRMRLHGMSADAWKRYEQSGNWRYTVEEAGTKANFTDLQAAIGRAQLRHLDDWQRRRAEVVQLYDAQLAGLDGIILPPRPVNGGHAWHLYVIRLTAGFGVSRDDVIKELARQGIGSSVHFIPVHHFPYFRNLLGAGRTEMKVADSVFPELLSLPLYPHLSDSDVDRVCQAIAAAGKR
ncbi:MAG: DegT/DnrJ/EryC1/StrS family aminotransferase [Acidimicrobiales bacterium]